MKFRYASFWLKALFLCALVIFSSMWCKLVFARPRQANALEDMKLKIFSLSVNYNGSVISSLYERGFDVNPRLCRTEKKVSLLVLIHSSHKEVQRRESIRHTWKAHCKMRNVSMAFFLGRTASETDKVKVLEESRIYGDIIVSRNLDSFEKLTLRSIAMAEWVSKNCAEVRFVVKADSDVFLNVPRLFQVVEAQKAAGKKRTVFGNLLHDTKPLRESSYKHRVSVVEYSADRYPDYMQGGAYMFTGDLAKYQFAAALDMNFFRMEDVFFTGFLTERLGANLSHVDGFFTMLPALRRAKLRDSEPEDYDVCDLRRRVAVHHGDYNTAFHLWQLSNYKSVRCTCTCKMS